MSFIFTIGDLLIRESITTPLPIVHKDKAYGISKLGYADIFKIRCL